MHDILDERLARLGGDLEDAAEIRSPALMRTRGEQIRVAHRRRMVAMTAATAAVAVIGVGSLVAFRGGQHDQPVSPGATVSSSTSAPTSQPVAVGQPVAVVDLSQFTMTVYDKDHQVLKTILVSAGRSAYPTAPGTFSITDRQEQVTLDWSVGENQHPYTVTAKWVILLGNQPALYAAPWDEGKFGKANASHGAIGMSTEDAKWLYDHVKVGDRIQFR
ncbi:MAG: L,D-transpeptidase [Catenulispora sp.]|nr:L,D-transpeptidase [Catenulispora sp.]